MSGARGGTGESRAPLYDPDREAPRDWGAVRDRLAVLAVRYGAQHSREIEERLERAWLLASEIRGVADLGPDARPRQGRPARDAGRRPALGGMLAVPPGSLRRIYRSPGPINDPEGDRADFWRLAPAVWAAGFRPDDVVLNTFSYHLTPGGMMLDSGLRRWDAR